MSIIVLTTVRLGVAEPSVRDQTLTRTLVQTLALVDIKVLDHFVIAGTSARSLRNEACSEFSKFPDRQLSWRANSGP
jgi:DNA repair protein RadC